MGKQLSSILLCLLLLTFITPHPAQAKQTQNQASYFSLFKDSLIAYTTIDTHNKQVLAAQTQITAIPPTLQPTQTPIQQPVQPNPQLSDVSSSLLNDVNAYRSSLGLSPVQASAQTCSFAATRAQEIAGGFSHEGFYNRVNNHTIPYSSWSRATENIAQAPDYKEVVTLWKNSPEHAANMRDNTPYVCIMQYNSYYVYEGMRP